MSDSEVKAVPTVAPATSSLAQRERFFQAPFLAMFSLLGSILLTAALGFSSYSAAAGVLTAFALTLQLVVMVFLALLIQRTRRSIVKP